MSNRWWEVDPDVMATVDDDNSNPNYTELENNEDRSSMGDLVSVGSGRRRRGRPPGSKNKTKDSSTDVDKETPFALRSHVIEISHGSDVYDSILAFAQRRHCGVSVLSGHGRVTSVNIRQRPADMASDSSAHHVMTLEGRFEILSLSGAFLPEPAPPGATGLTVYLAGGQGRVIGGAVEGSLVADGSVLVVVATFMNTTYERLPLEDEVSSDSHGYVADTSDQMGNADSTENLFWGLPPPHEAAENVGVDRRRRYRD